MTHKIIVLGIMIVTFSSAVLSQKTVNDTLSLKDGFWGLQYQKGSKEISSKEFEQLLQSAPDKSIYERYSKGSTQSTIAQVFAFGGGFCIGYGLTAKPTNSTLAIVGGVVAIGAFILDNSGKNAMSEAVSSYNSSLGASAYNLPVMIRDENKIFSLSLSLN